MNTRSYADKMKPHKDTQNLNTQTLANERIRTPQVRLIMADGTNKGVINTRDALSEARKLGLDLVAINPQAQPMVVKILDLNKYLYEEKRAAKARARKSRESEVQIKEVQMRPVTDAHDVSIKARNAQNWLQEGHRVKVVIKFRGREMAFKELGFQVLHKFLSTLGDHRVEQEPRMQGNQILIMLLPPVSVLSKE
jgi:translation initiation factor IF-3